MNTDQPEAREVRKLFEDRVPSIKSGVVVVRGIVREPGSRTILAVSSTDPATDAVGSCVVVRGVIIKVVVAELRGEFIDVVLWKPSAQDFFTNLFAPRRFTTVSFDDSSHCATAVLQPDPESAPPKNVAVRSLLFRQLTGWVLRLKT